MDSVRLRSGTDPVGRIDDFYLFYQTFLGLSLFSLRACVRACVRGCVRAWVRVCVQVRTPSSFRHFHRPPSRSDELLQSNLFIVIVFFSSDKKLEVAVRVRSNHSIIS